MSRVLFTRAAAVAGLVIAATGPLLLPDPAAARVFVGVGIGVPGYPAPYYYAPPPVYYPPPRVYYAPPPPVVYAPPPVTYAPPMRAAQSCYAGAYTCPMERPTTPGAACYCAGNGGNRVWGQAN
jgi:hypothetical protein